VKEILPNVVAVVLVYATLAIPTNITAGAALSFLGVGVRRDTPWGQMLNASQTSNWYQIYPGTCSSGTCCSSPSAFNLLGDAGGRPRSAAGVLSALEPVVT
jgi:peptide/nickel transport system permease protein